MRRLRKWLIGLFLFFAAFTLIGFFAVPPILKSVLVKKLSENLHREVKIDKVKVNPYTLSLTVTGLAVRERGGKETFASCDLFFVNLQSISLWKRALVLKELRLAKPYLKLARNEDRTYNFSDLMGKKGEQPEAKSKPFLFSLNNIRVENGSVDFWDGPPKKSHTIRDLNLGIPFLSNIPYDVETFVQPALSVEINNSSYALQGKSKPFADSLETTLDLSFTDLDLPFYLAYVPMKMEMQIASAFLDVKGKVSFIRKKGEQPSLTVSGDLALKKIAVDDREKAPLLRLPRVEVAIAESKPLAKIIHLSKVSVQSPEVEIRRNPKGDLALLSLLPKTEEAKPAGNPPENSSPLAIDIDEIEMTGGKLAFTDLSRKKPFKTVLNPVEVRVRNFSNGKDKESTYAASVKSEANEEVNLKGGFSLNPLKGEGAVEIKAIPLKKYAPYYQEMIRFELVDGKLDCSTNYQYAQKDKEMAIALKDIAAALRVFRLKKQGETEDFLKIPVLLIKDSEIDVSQAAVKIGNFSTEKGVLIVNRLKEGQIDLQNLVPAAPGKAEKAPPAEKSAEEKKWTVSLDHAKIDQYTLKMNDRSLSVPATLLVEKLTLSADNLSTAKNRKGKVALSLLLDRRTRVSAQTAIGLDPLQADGSLDVKQLVLKQYAPYYREKILFDIENGDLDFATRYQYAQREKNPLTKLSGISASLRTFQLKKRGEPEEFLAIPQVSVRNTALDLHKRELTVGEVSTAGGSLLVRRAKNGEINLQTLLPASPPGGPPSAPPPREPQAPKADSPWALRLGRLSLDQYRVKFEDQGPAEPVRLGLDEISLRAENLSTQKDRKGNVALSLRFDQKGTVAVKGTAGINPVAADLQTNLKEIAIRPLQPYFQDKVKIIVTDGSLSTTGALALSVEEGKGPRVNFKGDTSLNHFASIDKLNAADFLKWDSLSFTALDAGYNPFYLHLDGAALTDFYARLIIHSNGTLNLQNILEEEKKGGEKTARPAPKDRPAEKEPVEKAPSPVREIKINRVTLQGGQIDFSDDWIKPPYSANLMEVGGRISGLTSEEGKFADVELRGMLGQVAPLEISGKMNPLVKDLFVDLAIKLQDIDLSPMSPYSGKYVGYTIQKGKLSMDLKYLILKRKLDAQNRIFFDQFTLGDRVESESATKLPVRLAISLLKDRKGEIHLDVPVSGSLDDPKFSVFRVILQVLGNLIAKAATSPFALMGAIFGSGEQLDHLEFDYGSSALAGASAAKVNTLQKALKDRPGVKLEIEGHVDLEKDREGLKQLFFQRKIKAQKLKEIVKKGQAPVPVDEVKLEPGEYPKYLKSAYKEEKFPKPKNVIGLTKDLPAPEMEKLMLTHIIVQEGDLRTLASQRALRLRDALVQAGIEAERLFIVEPKSLAPEKKDKVKDSRVQIKLQ